METRILFKKISVIFLPIMVFFCLFPSQSFSDSSKRYNILKRVQSRSLLSVSLHRNTDFSFTHVISERIKKDLNLNWPVNFKNPQNYINDTFGPRIQNSRDNTYDFHHGIDITGSEEDIVHAAGSGTVYATYYEPNNAYPGGGNVVVIEHVLSSSDYFYFHSEQVTKFYSLYMHLSDISVNPGDIVGPGQVLGHIGNSGNTDFTHLHFEIRLETTCSMDSSCNHGYDPHINPLTFLPYSEINAVRVDQNKINNDLSISITMPRDDADFNRISLATYDRKNYYLDSMVLDLNNRTGMDATSTETLDNSLYNKIYIQPADFSDSVANWRMDIIFKDVFLNPAVDSYQIQIFDANGNQIF